MECGDPSSPSVQCAQPSTSSTSARCVWMLPCVFASPSRVRARASACACTRERMLMRMRAHFAHAPASTLHRDARPLRCMCMCRVSAGRDGDRDDRHRHGLVERAQRPLRRALGRLRNAQPSRALVCQLGPPRTVAASGHAAAHGWDGDDVAAARARRHYAPRLVRPLLLPRHQRWHGQPAKSGWFGFGFGFGFGLGLGLGLGRPGGAAARWPAMASCHGLVGLARQAPDWLPPGWPRRAASSLLSCDLGTSRRAARCQAGC